MKLFHTAFRYRTQKSVKNRQNDTEKNISRYLFWILTMNEDRDTKMQYFWKPIQKAVFNYTADLHCIAFIIIYGWKTTLCSNGYTRFKYKFCGDLLKRLMNCWLFSLNKEMPSSAETNLVRAVIVKEMLLFADLDVYIVC